MSERMLLRFRGAGPFVNNIENCGMKNNEPVRCIHIDGVDRVTVQEFYVVVVDVSLVMTLPDFGVSLAVPCWVGLDGNSKLFSVLMTEG